MVKAASSHVQHMQKSLTQMNLQIHNVISDITGVTGMAIIDAILAGERDPNVLANLKDRRIKAKKNIIAKSLSGDYRREHLFYLETVSSVISQLSSIDHGLRHGGQRSSGTKPGTVPAEDSPIARRTAWILAGTFSFFFMTGFQQ